MIKGLVMECDECGYVDTSYEDEYEALEEGGWFILQGPERYLGQDHRAYCSKECLFTGVDNL